MAHNALLPADDERAGFNMTIQDSNTLSKYTLTNMVNPISKVWFHNFMSNNPPETSPYQHQMAALWNGATLTTSQMNSWKSQATAYPGRKWLFMNEPDNEGQGKKTPAQYAEDYHTFYYGIKGVDSTAKIYAGGICQCTWQRIRWLDEMIYHYLVTYSEDFPCDGFHAHAYTMPEGFGPGVGFAYGLSNPESDSNVSSEAENATWWSTNKDKDVTIFKTYVHQLREYLAVNGFADKPLIISEFGMLRDFSTTDHANYLKQTFTYMLDAADTTYGCTTDNYRLVQEFAWFCINYRSGGTNYNVNSWLFNFASPYAITVVGTAFHDWWLDYFDAGRDALKIDANSLLLNTDGSRIII